MRMSVVAALAATATIVASATQSAVESSMTTGSPGSITSMVTSGLPSVVASILPSGVTTTAPLTSSVITLPQTFELAATFAGGLAGALVAVRAEFDAVGVTTIAIVSGLGGGIIRDVLLQDQGIYALERPGLLAAVLLAAVVAFFFSGAARHAKLPMDVIDAISLGLFAVAGSDKSLLAGLTVIPVIMLGTITAVGGGLLRDILMGKVPHILRPGTLYAAAAVIGSVVYVLLAGWLNIVKPVALAVVVVLVVLLRVIAILRGWNAPVPRDFTPEVSRIPRHAVRWILRSPNDANQATEHSDDDSPPNP
jgi:uncharacterized membrane protein YeiH